ncbi:hypothetical protein ACEPAF_6528 [Sanghuangporus sanghuang]
MPTTDLPAHIQPRLPINPRPAQRLKLEHNDANIASAEDSTRSPTVEQDVSQAKQPAKRARKAINCEPCRNSKLKCDRGRPCSSCVLRGTVMSCYQGAANDPADDNRSSKIDPHHEIAHIRQSLASLEAYIVRSGTGPAYSSAPSSSVPQGPSPSDSVEKLTSDAHETSNKSVPGMLNHKGQGGLYAGPTSMVTHLLSFKSPEQREGRDVDNSGDDSTRSSDEGSAPNLNDQTRSYDNDLLELLPQLHIIDGLVDFYFEYCNWMYRHVHPQSFMAAWKKFKTGQSSDRLVLATLCVIMSVAIRYIPAQHALLVSLPPEHEELCERYYDIARESLSRYRLESRALSLELVELLLVRTHYLTLSKKDAEEIWSIRGELVSIGTAMGLHRDPDKWKMPREVAERRRWCWWHIILLERWQCFLFGRPLSIASHHFDTRMPSHIDTEIDPDGRLFLPNLHLFRLAFVLGSIVDDAVSIRPVPYERVQERDRELVTWMEDLPKELDLDEYRLARSLASPLPAYMRLGVQSIIVRTSYYHIRFSLHRPYAAAAHDVQQRSLKRKGNTNNTMSEHMSQSLDTAVNAADKLIQLVGQARPDLLANSSLAVPGHVHWGPFHCFSAAMFFSFQLIENPDQPGANLFRANIRRVVDILRMSSGVAIADKAMDMLTALAPLYEPAPPGETPEQREMKKKQVLSRIKGLAFPYHDSPAHPRSHLDSPNRRGMMDSSSHSSSVSPPSATHGIPPLPPGNGVSSSSQLHLPHNMAGPLDTPIDGRSTSTHNQPPPYAQTAPHVQQSVRAGTPHNNAPLLHYATHHVSHSPQFGSAVPQYVPQLQQPRLPHQPYPVQAPEYGEAAYVQGANDSMWGASVGFGQGEWVRFLNVMERPDTSSHM